MRTITHLKKTLNLTDLQAFFYKGKSIFHSLNSFDLGIYASFFFGDTKIVCILDRKKNMGGHGRILFFYFTDVSFLK